MLVPRAVAPVGELTARRAERAVDLIRTTDLPVAQVAAACGFASQPQLNDVLRIAVGATPTEIQAR